MAHRNWNRSGQNYYSGGMNRVGGSYSHNSYGGSGGGGKQHRQIYGIVTKLFDNFGYVDDEIFFMKSVVRGPLPRVGDRVICEANYQPNMPVKWNAEMVRILDKGGRGGPPSRHRPDLNRSRDGDDRNKRPRPGRYEVAIPLHPFTLTEASVPLVRSRYPNLYIPSDFFQCNFRWLDVFPMHQPMKLGHSSNFYIIHRDVESLVDRGEDVLEPADADYTYSAKVMLLASPALAELYRRSCRLAEDKDCPNDDQAYRLVQFLVGVKGRNDLMPIGGPWSPSLDGENPGEDHHVLVNTAVRTCKALTGIDLSHCTQWFRFLELYYYRPAEKSSKTGKMREARVETVVVFVPDIWSCMPAEDDWKATRDSYQELLDGKLNPPEPEPQVELMEAIDEAVDEEAGAEENAEADEEQAASQEEEDTPNKDDGEGGEVSDQPTHFSKLDPKTMKVAELKQELEVRNLSSKGLKAQLTARLAKALEEEESEEKKLKELEDAAAKQVEEAEEKEKEEKEAEKTEEPAEKEAEAEPKAESETKAEAEPESKPEATVELSEKERKRLERIYTLPESPAIICHPNMAAKSGKFDVQVFSLKHLLDYRMDGGAKEYTFEVSLFAEQFNHMLQRDSAFSIYKALVVAPEPAKEEEKDEKATEEPEAKRARKEPESEPEVEVKDEKEAAKPRVIRRTVDPALLFSFVYFDRCHAGYLIDKDLESIVHGLGLSLSRSQIRRLIGKLSTAPGRSSMVLYRSLTDKEVEEGAKDDVTSLRMAELDDEDYVLELSMGNRALWDEDAKPMEARVVGLAGEDTMIRKVEKAEDARLNMELQFKQIREELESTRKDLGRTENSEKKMGEEIKNLTEKVRNHRQFVEELRSLNATYQRILRYSRDQSDRVTKEITTQFDKEKEKRERERERERKEKEEKEAKEKEAKGETEKEEVKEEEEEKKENGDTVAKEETKEEVEEPMETETETKEENGSK